MKEQQQSGRQRNRGNSCRRRRTPQCQRRTNRKFQRSIQLLGSQIYHRIAHRRKDQSIGIVFYAIHRSPYKKLRSDQRAYATSNDPLCRNKTCLTPAKQPMIAKADPNAELEAAHRFSARGRHRYLNAAIVTKHPH